MIDLEKASAAQICAFTENTPGVGLKKGQIFYMDQETGRRVLVFAYSRNYSKFVASIDTWGEFEVEKTCAEKLCKRRLKLIRLQE